MTICIHTRLVDLMCPNNLPKKCKLSDRSTLRSSYVHHFTKVKISQLITE